MLKWEIVADRANLASAKHNRSLIIARKRACDIAKLVAKSTGGGGASNMSDKKSDEKKLRLIKVNHSAVHRDKHYDWYRKAYERFSISKARTEQLIDDIEKLTLTTKPIFH